MRKFIIIIASVLVAFSVNAQWVRNYKNFTVSVYVRAYEVQKMANKQWLDSSWNVIAGQLKVDKIYLETHRDKIIVDEPTLVSAKKFFQEKGIEVVGGITYTIDERNHFETFCYSNPEHRKLATDIATYTAKHFDEYILDDFFFTSCKCNLCINAKGAKSWTQYRLDLMKSAAEEIVIKPSKVVNPKVKVIIKYPNWYEHFHGLGFNLEAGPKQFDGIYTGTETRDPERTGQHLQQYESYLIFRYFENISPGKNGGGWVDPGAMFYADRYAEQLWNTVFAKAPEITLFDYRQLLHKIKPTDRGEWQQSGLSFDFDQMMKPYTGKNGQTVQPTSIARFAGYALEQVDPVVGALGKPLGIKSYRPYHASGEDFLHNYFGMIGIPMDIQPEFPTDGQIVILTEAAKSDQQLVEKIKNRLKNGGDVVITSGLLCALQGKGIEEIVELKCPLRKVLSRNFVVGRRGNFQSNSDILFPQIEYLTNDSWEDISIAGGASGWPLLHQAMYSRGSLFVLTIPENFADLYKLPVDVLNRIRNVVSRDVPFRIEGPAQVALYVYDNGTCIVESYCHESIEANLIVHNSGAKIIEFGSNIEMEGVQSNRDRVWGKQMSNETTFKIALNPHSYRVFRIE